MVLHFRLPMYSINNLQKPARKRAGPNESKHTKKIINSHTVDKRNCLSQNYPIQLTMTKDSGTIQLRVWTRRTNYGRLQMIQADIQYDFTVQMLMWREHLNLSTTSIFYPVTVKKVLKYLRKAKPEDIFIVQTRKYGILSSQANTLNIGLHRL